MKPHARIRKTIKWGGAAVVLLVVSPIGMMAAFVGVSIACVKGLPAELVAMASIPYLILGAGAGLMCLRSHSRRGPLWIVVPSMGLAVYHALMIAGSVRSAAQPPSDLYLSSVQATGMTYGVSGLMLGLLALCWVVVVFAAGWGRSPRTTPEGFCSKCRYDRTGLAAGAVCPECGKGAA